MKELTEFIVKAKKNTYASGLGKVESSRRLSTDLYYRENEYEYADSYFGAKEFSGQEVVYRDNLPVWSMNYYGKIIDKNFLLKYWNY
ncbi:MAG: hypothetical protein JXQ23_11370 [Clostridia bacterium]|nr:hypothetical protein [Clostridia bacterium]